MNSESHPGHRPQVDSDKANRAPPPPPSSSASSPPSLQSAESLLAQTLALPLRAARYGFTLQHRVFHKAVDSALYARTTVKAYAPVAVTEYTENKLMPFAKDRAAATKSQVQVKTQELVGWVQTKGRARAPEKMVRAFEQTAQQLDGVRTDARQLADKGQEFVEATLQDPDNAARSLASAVVDKSRIVMPQSMLGALSVGSDITIALYKQAMERMRGMRKDIAVQYEANMAYFRDVRLRLADKASEMYTRALNAGNRVAAALSPKSYIDLSREQSVASALDQLFRDVSKNPYVVRTVDALDDAVVRYMPVGIVSWTRRSFPRSANGHDRDLQREHEEETNGHSTAVDDQAGGNAERRKKKKKPPTPQEQSFAVPPPSLPPRI